MKSNGDQKTKSDSRDVPLCVDLDGTLLRSDTLKEAVRIGLLQNPFVVIKFIYYLWIRDRLAAKRWLFDAVLLDYERLPYSSEVLTFLHEEKKRGRKLHLVTGAVEIVARSVAERFDGLFDGILFSDKSNNTGERKMEMMEEQFGVFDYLGNSSVDIPVWQVSRIAYLANVNSSTLRKVKSNGIKKVVLIYRNTDFLTTVLRFIRIHQWSKNVLLFLPVVLSHTYLNHNTMAIAFGSFVAFCFVSSMVYVINDIFDLEADRNHYEKKKRPLANGDITIIGAFFVFLVLLCGLLSCLLFLPLSFFYIVILYVVLNVIYSNWIKRVVVLDAFVLASFYIIRILAGGEAVGVAVSSWLLAFSLFFFLSLGLMKRYSDLLKVCSDDDMLKIPGREYSSLDLPVVLALGSSSGIVSVLLLVLYTNSSEVSSVYRKPDVLWLMCPLMTYWIARAWLLTGRKLIGSDPILFALCDRVSWLILAILGVLLMVGKYLSI